MSSWHWTEARDAMLRRLREAGHAWPVIAQALAVSPDRARERGRRLGVRCPPRHAALRDDPARPPLPPGDPRSWGLLTAGTVLEGTQWPNWQGWGARE